MKSKSVKNPRSYKKALVTLIDVLGFKNLIANSDCDEIYRVLHQKNYMAGEIDIWRSFAYQHNYIFSDLVVTAKFYRQNVNPDEIHLAFFASTAQHLRIVGGQQFDLACSGTFVRGGISLGDIYADKKTIFGPALIRAYELESQIARWPIIVFDRELIAEFELRQNEWSDSFSNEFNSFITRTENGLYFLDYLGVMRYEDSTTGDLDYKLDDHRKAIIAAFARTSNETYREKYYFLAAYHDRKCEQYGYPALKIGLLK